MIPPDGGGNAPDALSGSKRSDEPGADIALTRGDISASVSLHRSTTVVYDNTASNEIRISEPTLRLAARDYIERASAKFEWVIPVGILVPLIITLTTVDTYKAAFGIDAATWHAVFLVGSVACAAWAIVAIVRCMGRRVTIDSFIDGCKPK